MVYYHWTNCVKGFNLPLALIGDGVKIRVLPTDEWKSTVVNETESRLFDPTVIKNWYYINVAEVVKKS